VIVGDDVFEGADTATAAVTTALAADVATLEPLLLEAVTLTRSV
jgi:hypothetical protein